jgi:hypothetical protein
MFPQKSAVQTDQTDKILHLVRTGGPAATLPPIPTPEHLVGFALIAAGAFFVFNKW